MKEIWHIALAVMLMRSALFDITVLTSYIARYLTLRKGPIWFCFNYYFPRGQQVTYNGLIFYFYAFKKNSLKE